jgi:hypothetical protein
VRAEPLADDAFTAERACVLEHDVARLREGGIEHEAGQVPERRPPAEGPDDYDVVGTEGMIIGRIFKTATAPAGTPWMWTLSYGDDRDRTPHGYEPTREAAMAAFAKSWRRE